MDSDNNDVRRGVLAVLEDCSQCHTPYRLDDARVVGQTGNLWVLAIRCSHCASQAFVAAVVGDDDIDVDSALSALLGNELGDLSEVVAEYTTEPVTVDDVLDMHEFLDSFDGDFHRLFGRRAR
jgi:hypothetical protein